LLAIFTLLKADNNHILALYVTNILTTPTIIVLGTSHHHCTRIIKTQSSFRWSKHIIIRWYIILIAWYND